MKLLHLGLILLVGVLIIKAVDAYNKALKEYKKPWITGREVNPSKIIWSTSGRTSDAKYNVTHDSWSNFMNEYAISPVPESNVPGSDYAKELFTLEWDVDFPTEGEYTFRGLYDGDTSLGDFYVDSKKIGTFQKSDKNPKAIKKIYKSGQHKLRFDLKNNSLKKASAIQPTIDFDDDYDSRFVKEGKNFYYLIEKANDLVSIDFELNWNQTVGGKQTVTKITLDSEDEPLVFEVPKLDAEPPASLPNLSMLAPWVKSWQGESFWDWSRGEFLRTYAVFPVRDNSLNGVWQTGIWTIDITTPGNYTIELMTDDPGKVNWDGSFIGETTYDYGRYNGPKIFTLNNVTTGKHELKGEIQNNFNTRSWRRNPGGLAWVLKNPSGQIVRSSIDDFNTPLPQGYRSIGFDVTRHAGDINKIIFNGMNFTATGDITNSTTDRQNAVVEEGVAYQLSYYGSGGRTCFFKVENGGSAIGLDDDGGRRSARVGYYVGANLLVSASEGEFYEQDGSFYYKVRKSNLEEDLGKSGDGYEANGVIKRTGTFQDGKKYRVVFEQQPDSATPKINDTGIFNNALTDTGLHDDQIMSFRPLVDRTADGSLILAPKSNSMLAARNSRQLSPPKKVSSYSSTLAPSVEIRSIFNTKDWIDRSNRELWKYTLSHNAFNTQYSVTPFDPHYKLPNMPYAGDHDIVWTNVNFPISATYKIEIRVDDDLRLKIGDQVDIFKKGFAYGQEATTYDSFGSAVEAVGKGKFTSTGKSTYTKWIEKGTYTLTATLTQIPGGSWPSNTSHFGINIETGVVEEDVLDDTKSWNENPLGLALNIESPLPLPPVQALPKGDGVCPPNPIWHTRYPNAKEQWSPVIGFPFWSKFLNKYALSPVPPLNNPGTDGTGVVYRNTWTVDLPYSGKYGLKGAVDNWGRILIDDQPWQRFSDEKRSSIEVAGSTNNTLAGPTQKKQPLARVQLEKGQHTITVEVENWKNYQTPRSFIDKKIFNTQDWQSPNPSPTRTYVDVNFGVQIRTLLGASIQIKGLFDRAKDYGADGIGPPAPPKSRTINFEVFRAAGDINKITFNGMNFTATGDIPNETRGITQSASVEEGKSYQLSYYGSGGRTCFFNVENSGASIGLDDDGGRRSVGYYEGPNLLVTASEGEFYEQNGSFFYRLRKSSLNDTLTGDRYRNIDDKFTQKVEKGRVYDVVITSTGKERLTGEGRSSGNRISYTGLHSKNDPINVSNNGTKLKFKDGHGDDSNGTFTITRVSGGKATFNSSGKSIDVTGKDVKVTLHYGWNDKPWSSGKALDSIKIGDKTWTQSSEKRKGSQTRTVTLSEGKALGGDGSNHFQLRTKGDNVIQMEDLWGWEGVGNAKFADGSDGVWFDDVVCTASQGRFYDIQGNTAKYVIGGDMQTESVRNGVVYKGPKLYNYKHPAYGTFLRKCGVSPDYPKIGGVGDVVSYEWSNVDFDADGEYDFHFANDAHGSFFLDGKEIIRGAFDREPGVSAFDAMNWSMGQRKKVNVNKGKHIISVRSTDRDGGGNEDGLFRKLDSEYYKGNPRWDQNPSAMALSITRREETFPVTGSAQDVDDQGNVIGTRRLGKSWYQNPIAVSAALIPAPCKQPTKGKGVVTRVEIEDPGTGFPKPRIPTGIGTYPVALRLTKIVVIDGGTNYGDPTKYDDDIGLPPTGITTERDIIPKLKIHDGEYEPEFNPFGGIGTVRTSKPGIGFTENPAISFPSPTGINARFRPVFEVVRDPIYLDLQPDQLIQVTDLVGIKQTGYYDGRPYYGAVFYKDGTRYAGYYETAGKLIQIYDTLQESIDARTITPPSAIQRQGTDISSNDPRLNIPGTPENLI